VRVQTITEVEDALARTGVNRLRCVRRGAVDDGGSAIVQDYAVKTIGIGRAEDLGVRFIFRTGTGCDGAQQRAFAGPGRAFEYVDAQTAAQQDVKLRDKAVGRVRAGEHGTGIGEACCSFQHGRSNPFRINPKQGEIIANSIDETGK